MMLGVKHLESIANRIKTIEDYDRSHKEPEHVYIDGPIKVILDGSQIGLLQCEDHGIWMFEEKSE